MAHDPMRDAQQLMIRFSELRGPVQKNFIELLNRYLLASSSRRLAMRNEWVQLSVLRRNTTTCPGDRK